MTDGPRDGHTFLQKCENVFKNLEKYATETIKSKRTSLRGGKQCFGTIIYFFIHIIYLLYEPTHRLYCDVMKLIVNSLSLHHMYASSDRKTESWPLGETRRMDRRRHSRPRMDRPSDSHFYHPQGKWIHEEHLSGWRCGGFGSPRLDSEAATRVKTKLAI